MQGQSREETTTNSLVSFSTMLQDWDTTWTRRMQTSQDYAELPEGDWQRRMFTSMRNHLQFQKAYVCLLVYSIALQHVLKDGLQQNENCQRYIQQCLEASQAIIRATLIDQRGIVCVDTRYSSNLDVCSYSLILKEKGRLNRREMMETEIAYFYSPTFHSCQSSHTHVFVY